MHVSSFTSTLSLDPNPNNWNSVLQILITVFLLLLGFFYLLRSTASKYFVVDTNFNTSSSCSSSSSSSSSDMTVANSNCNSAIEACANCGNPTSKQCAGCKRVKYCSQSCQSKHWRSGHKKRCQELKHSGKENVSITLASSTSSGTDKTQKVVDKVLFPYDEFVKFYDWDKPIFPPCGLLNCGNSCYANVVLQCLAHTRPLLTYLLERGHRRDCRRNGWCFLCELETYLTRASRNPQPFSPLSILSRLPSIGSNLGYGRQEDAHEFMRFAIDAMQSVCLDEYGGEKVIDLKSQETTLIQHIFGGQLRSQIICTKCNQVSNQYENMMDLTVEIQGEATSLQECLDQFTAKEWLHGENMYKCDGCKDYVSAWKHLTIHQAPNVLTIALKRFQSGRFGKINKKISFPENLDLSPYMSEEGDGTDKYKLYAIIVHVDMLNASFFGHYICYTKGFQGDWYRIDDCKVTRVELEEVLSQGAYMLMYRRISARPKCLKTFGTTINQKQNGDTLSTGAEHNSTIQHDDPTKPSSSNCSSVNLASDVNGQVDHPHAPAVHLSRALGDSSILTVASTEVPVKVADIPGSSTLGANALDEASCEIMGATTNQKKNGEMVSIGAEHSSTIQLDESLKLSSSNCRSAYPASDVNRPLDHLQTPVHLLRALGDGNDFSKTLSVASTEVPVADTPGSSSCEGLATAVNGISASSGKHLDAESFAPATINQTAACCERKDSKLDNLGLGKKETEVYSDDIEVETVEVDESDDQSNSVNDDMIVDSSPINI